MLFSLILIISIGSIIQNKFSGNVTNENIKIITNNPLDITQIERISKFRSCYGHDYSGLNINGEKEPLSSMKHYIEPFSSLMNTKDKIKVFAPFDGKITEIIYYDKNDQQIFISSNEARAWHFIFFHIAPLPEIIKGKKVKSGELIGYVNRFDSHNFDFALKKFEFFKKKQ